MLYRLVHIILRLVGLTTLHERRLLVGEIILREKELEAMSDSLEEAEEENKSLWMMLDELQSSSKGSKENVESFVKEMQDAVLDELLKDFDPIGEA
jgi:predicted RNase H-like nuclease (RuvC/YqgF family)